MNSYDLYNTLVAARSSYRAGDVPIEEHIPIAQNIATVKPDDVIVSDYHDPAKAEAILRTVCKLPNRLIVTENGKARGTVWSQVNSAHHLGDNQVSDVASPRQHGIPADYTDAWQMTPEEKQCDDLGWVMREARLRTWHSDPVLRALQLHQIERNFPFIYAVAHKINERMIAGGYEKLMLCSRDCYLLHMLMRSLFAGYDIDYFLTSRYTRWCPSPTYADYAKERLSGKTLVVDLTGSGHSLKYLCDQFGGDPLLVCSINTVVPALVSGGVRETSNPAPHPTVIDYAGVPIYSNPAGIDWRKPDHAVMLAAFELCCLGLRTVITPTYSIDRALTRLVNDRSADCLLPDHLTDSKYAYDLLAKSKLPEGAVIIP